MPEPALDPKSINTNYFVCTLGQAAALKATHPRYSTINNLVDELATVSPDAPAVGFPKPPATGSQDDKWEDEIFDFRGLRQQSMRVARQLSKDVLPPPSNGVASRTVAILCSSSSDFLLLWLGLTRLGYASLQIAPQCQPAAIAHLCETCNVSLLFCDDAHDALAQNAAEKSMSDHEGLSLEIHKIPLHLDGSDQPFSRDADIEPYWPVKKTDTAFIHHSSGTSSGLPKPIPQTHNGAVAVLPCLAEGINRATFTTTPLYHGGVADCFRAWTSGAMIWLFPGKDLPITASNTLKCLRIAEEAAMQETRVPRVAYFSSVPYVLQMLAEEQEGLKVLRNMDIVGVGGAALPPKIGDSLVEKGVNLVSRFGSVECGFLLSSHRDYREDKAWQYLRAAVGADTLRFERQDDDLAELIVTQDWPQMNKINRPDGSLATADLFAPHPTIPHAWKYHSRADSQLTLVTGKKFDPAPLETAIAGHQLLKDVLIFGNGQPFPGALLIPSADSRIEGNALVEAVWPTIAQLNNESQPHARISKAMLVPLEKSESSIEKSSKGTILRAQAEKRYASIIRTSYEKAAHHVDDIPNGTDKAEIPDEEVEEAVADIVATVTGYDKDIPVDADLFSQGVDSVACMQIRGLLQKRLLNETSGELPLNVVYDCGSIDKLAKYLVKRRHGHVSSEDDEGVLMRDLAAEYSQFKPSPTVSNVGAIETQQAARQEHVVVLTGATGALGAHLLASLQARDDISHIICLVRAKDSIAARERVNKSLMQREKALLGSSNDRIACISAQLSEPDLGLSEEAYRDIAAKATIFIHAAWAVNFSMRLRSFVKDHIAGLQHLTTLAASSTRKDPPAFLFCSSTASVLGPNATFPIPEAISDNPCSASPLGYSRSKWVAEKICYNAHQKTRLRGRISVLRVGQLCGDTRNGVWNATEAWPLMLSSVRVTGTLPRLDEPLSWLPVDIAASAILEIALADDHRSKMDEGTPIFHIVNNDRTTTWTDLLCWYQQLEPPFTVVEPRQWVSQLEELQGDAASHPARKLLGLWKSAYESDKPSSSSDDNPPPLFSTTATKSVSSAIAGVRPISEGHFRLIYRWMEREMFGEVAQDVSGQ
ncbi:MAG: putative NRPS-like protein biosynthetic cluster [Caeruleum heppii]|nr:MAG: putative NRPS-like protein biosynthetic cluster [Caeruleum heppii]